MSARTQIAEIEKHRVRSGETLASLATAAGLTTAELARFNFGTDCPAEVDKHLRDDVGCTRDAKGDLVFDDNDDPGIILIPKTFARTGLLTDQLHTIWVRTVAPAQNFHKCICIPGLTYAFDKSFIRPLIADHIHRLEAALQEFPQAKLIVFGHTDRVGGEQYNKELSERRAQSAYAFVTRQAWIWEKLYNQENWGVKVIQEILADLAQPARPTSDPGPSDAQPADPKLNPGPSDGVMGPKTQGAMREFLNRPPNAPVSNDRAFREQLFTAYMMKYAVHVPVTGLSADSQVSTKTELLTKAQFFPPWFMGCGEFNPLVKPNENELANGGRGQAPGNEPNRRVVFYLFRRPPRTIPCQLGNVAPCKVEMAKGGERKNPLHKCAFYDGIAQQCHCERSRVRTVAVRLFDADGTVLPHAPFEMEHEGDTVSGEADGNGDILVVDATVPSSCVVRWRAASRPLPPSPTIAADGPPDLLADEIQEPPPPAKPLSPEFEFELEVQLDAGLLEPAEGTSDGETIWRLHNLGYHKKFSVDENLRCFHRDCLHPEGEAGLNLKTVRAEAIARHDGLRPPGRKE